MSPNQIGFEHGTPPVVGPQSSVHSNGSTGPEVAAAHTGDPGASRLPGPALSGFPRYARPSDLDLQLNVYVYFNSKVRLSLRGSGKSEAGLFSLAARKRSARRGAGQRKAPNAAGTLGARTYSSPTRSECDLYELYADGR
jgi:hypothetical protein